MSLEKRDSVNLKSEEKKLSVESQNRKNSYELTSRFFSLWKTLRMHGESNETVVENLKNFKLSLSYFKNVFQEVEIKFNGVDIITNGFRIRAHRLGDDYITEFADFFMSLYVGKVVMNSQIDGSNIIKFFKFINQFPFSVRGKESTYKKLKAMLHDENFKHVKVHIYEIYDSRSISSLNKKELIAEVFKRLVTDYAGYQKKCISKEPYSVADIMRNIQIIVDLFYDNNNSSIWNYSMLLATMNSFRGSYTAVHSVNTLFLAIAIGTELSIPREKLRGIGLAAYFHEVAVPDYSNFHADDLENHKIRGLINMIRDDSFETVIAEAAVVAFHHIHTESDIKPDNENDEKMVSIAEQIVSVAAFYDFETRLSLSNQKPISRLQALDKIFKLSSKNIFNIEYARALVSAVGKLPIGDLLKIKDRDFFAVPVERCDNEEGKRTIFLLDHNLKFIKKAAVDARELVGFETEEHIEIPSYSFAKMLQV